MAGPIAELEQMWQITAPFPWQVVALVMIGLSFSLVAIAYMLGRLFDSDRLKKWAYGEFLTTLATLVIVAMLITFVTMISNAVFKLSMEIMRLSSPAYYDVIQKELTAKGVTQDVIHFFPAQQYLNSMGRCVRQLYVINICSALIIEPMADMAEDLSGSATIGAALPTVVVRNALRTFATTLTFLQYATYLQKNLLLMIQQIALVVFLPVGIVLRTFPLTRGAGNLFMALSIGAYFVYPLSYSMLLILSSPPADFENRCGVSVEGEALSPLGGCGRAIGQSAILASVLLVPTFGIDKLLSAAGIGKFFTLSGLQGLSIGVGVAAPAIYAFIDQIKPLLIEVVVYAIVYPFIVMAVTLTFIKSFATFLGADAQDMVEGLIRII